MARFALFTNGVKVETLDDLKGNFNIKDMLENYRNKALHRWLMVNRMTGELSQVEAITATEDNAVVDELVKIFEVPAETIEEQKRVLAEKAQKKEEVLSQLERELLTDIEKNDFLKYMDDSSDSHNIIALLQKHAERGNPVAQLKLGWCFENEKGVEKNTELAVEWYKKSAEQGLARAQNCLGYCFQYGIGIKKDEGQAVVLYRKAIEQNSAEGLTLLGSCYKEGMGVEKNIESAITLYKTAAEQKFPYAQYLLGCLYYNGQEISQDVKEGMKWLRSAAEQGVPEAAYLVGDSYEIYRGINYGNTDFCMKEAFNWYTKSAQAGYAPAQCKVGAFLASGLYVAKDEANAFKWFKMAALSHNSEGEFRLGMCYFWGHGVEEDSAKAKEYFKLAASQSHKGALRALDEYKFN